MKFVLLINKVLGSSLNNWEYFNQIADHTNMKTSFTKKTILVLASVCCMQLAHAQIDMPQASPKAKLETRVGLTDVELVYSRPGLKGRDKKIFGDLIPYGKVWRTGANESTKITFSDDVTIDGHPLPAGTYALYTIPEENEWTVIFHNNLELWGDSGYQQEQDALRVQVKPTAIAYPQETFTIDITNHTSNSAALTILWDNTLISVPIETEVDSRVMAQIEEKMQEAEVNPSTYFQAANYYYQNNKDMNQALDWINKALESRQHFVFYNVKSKILAEQKKYKEAIKAAEKSKELANKENNQDYVRINDDLIARYKERK